MKLTDRVQARAEERRWWILAVLCFSLLVIVLDNSILNVALPTIVRELHATNTQLQWMVDSYFGAQHKPVGVSDPTAPGAFFE